jgi:hypothetical protein
MKQLFSFFFLGVLLTFESCKNEKAAAPVETETTPLAEAPAAPAAPTKVVAISHIVKDYDAWKKAYDTDAPARAAAGLSPLALCRGVDNPNLVHVFLVPEDFDKAKAFAENPALKEAMQKGGVTSTPELLFVDIIRFAETPMDIKGRVRIAHKVKDFDTWLKAYDAEGTETRAQHGLVDRSVSRNHDDPSMAYVVFGVSDIAKAKARFADPAFKKLMTDAGVLSAPKVDFYTVVE